MCVLLSLTFMFARVVAINPVAVYDHGVLEDFCFVSELVLLLGERQHMFEDNMICVMICYLLMICQYFAKEIHCILGVMIRTFILEHSLKIFQSTDY